MWISWVVALTISSGAGFIGMKYPRIGVLIIGAWIGGLVGSFIYKAIIYAVSASNPMLGLYLTVLGSSIIIAVLSFVFFDYAVIFGSAFIGAYCITRGISIFFGGFTNELVIYEEVNSTEYNIS